MKIAFQVPCVVRGRLGRGKALKSVITTTQVDFDVPAVKDQDIVWSYAAELGRRADGYTHYYQHEGQFYTRTGFYDNDTVQNGWREGPWQAETPLYGRLWRALLEDLLETGIGKGEDPNLSTVMIAVSGSEDESDRLSAWNDLQTEAASLKMTSETEEDFEEARRKAARVLDDLIIYRREIQLRTRQPGYAVHIRGRKAKIAIESTEVHERLRAAAFEHPTIFPFNRSNERVDALKHYFAIEERDAMLAFVETAGARVVGQVPRASRLRWANHDETIDGLELDRIARIAVHEIALAFASSTLYHLPSVLLRTPRAFFNAFYDLKEFLEQRLDPEEASEETASKLAELHSLAAFDRPGSPGLVNCALGAFLDLALSRFGDRRINAFQILPPAGPVPRAT